MPEPSVAVLCYHTFDSPKKTPYSISSSLLKKQLHYLAIQRIPVIPLQDLYDHMNHHKLLPPKAVIITIDDGYKTARTIAAPLLQKQGVPFTLFVYPKNIGRRNGMSWEDVQELSKEGVDIQSHSMNHPLLTHPHQRMNPKDYDAWLDQELLESRKLLESKIKKPVRFIAYPFGGYDEHIVQKTKEAGYLAAFTCDDGNAYEDTFPLRVPRRLVLRGQTWRRFVSFFQAQELNIENLSPRPGERLRGFPETIGGTITNIHQIDPNTLKILVDEWGGKRVLVPVDPHTGLFKIPYLKPRRYWYNFVSLFAKDKDNPHLTREASFIFILSRNVSKN